MVRECGDRIRVLYMGRVVEIAPRDRIFDHAAHPYTQSLISAVPVPDPTAERARARLKLPGELPSALDPAAALRFLPSRKGMVGYNPTLQEVAPGHWVAEHDPLDAILAEHPRQPHTGKARAFARHTVQPRRQCHTAANAAKAKRDDADGHTETRPCFFLAKISKRLRQHPRTTPDVYARASRSDPHHVARCTGRPFCVALPRSASPHPCAAPVRTRPKSTA